MDPELQPRRLLGRELVADVARNFGEVRLRVTGASMIPAIWPGEVVTVRRRDKAELQPGQIVLSRRGGRLLAHRITRICDDLVTTRGDSLCEDDAPVSASDIVGQVSSLIRNGRRVPVSQSFWQRVCSSLLRRSDFCMRIVLRVNHRILRHGGAEFSWER
jgi:signal peptidase I